MKCWDGRGVSIRFYWPGKDFEDKYNEEPVHTCGDCGRLIYRDPTTEYGWNHATKRWLPPVGYEEGGR